VDQGGLKDPWGIPAQTDAQRRRMFSLLSSCQHFARLLISRFSLAETAELTASALKSGESETFFPTGCVHAASYRDPCEKEGRIENKVLFFVDVGIRRPRKNVIELLDDVSEPSGTFRFEKRIAYAQDHVQLEIYPGRMDEKATPDPAPLGGPPPFGREEWGIKSLHQIEKHCTCGICHDDLCKLRRQAASFDNHRNRPRA
jgi:hypothetical protein